MPAPLDLSSTQTSGHRSARNPVLLVHGITDTSDKMKHIASHLWGLGWEVFDIDLQPSNGDVNLEILAVQIADRVKTFLDRWQQLTGIADQQIDLIGFSMGGLVSRYYVQRLGGIDQVQRFITISSPHNGTIAANFSLKPGCRQMRPNSTFMKDLSSDVDLLKSLNFTSLWTPFDLIILPPTSSKLGIGTEQAIPVLAHPLMVNDQRIFKAIVDALSQSVKSPI
jgi:triacylglycerol lipase